MLKWFILSQTETARRARGAVVMALGLALFFGAFTWSALEILAGPDVGGVAGEPVGGELVGRSVVTTGAGAGEPGSGSAGAHGEHGEPGERGAVSK